MRAAFTGLIGGVIALLLVVTGIVMLTNKKYEGHEAAPAGAHAPAAPGAPH
jgi:glucose uptake protein GlcU